MPADGSGTLTGLGAWRELPFFADGGLSGVEARIAADARPVLPPKDVRFRALELIPPGDVRAVILGQDPYPTPGNANGLAFSVSPGTAVPASLRNIFREVEADTGAAPPSGDLTGWARQGVLLLNTVLSVPAGVAGGHRGLGWERLAGEVLAHVSRHPTAFLLWGKPAQAMRRHIAPGDHLVIETAHPSPLSARRGFIGSRPFSRVNAWLEARGERPIDWSAGAPK